MSGQFYSKHGDWSGRFFGSNIELGQELLHPLRLVAQLVLSVSLWRVWDYGLATLPTHFSST